MTASFKISQSAAQRITQVVARKQKNGQTGKDAPCALRITVDSGGCNGFQYLFKLITAQDISGDDIIVKKDGAEIVIDSTSLPFLEGAQLDFTKELMGAHFSVDNPNAASSCGCGTSFSPV